MKDFDSMMYVWKLAFLFKLVAGIGLVLFIVWAAKLKQDKLKKLVIWLLAVGILGCLLSSVLFGGNMYQKMGKDGKWYGDMMMEDVTE